MEQLTLHLNARHKVRCSATARNFHAQTASDRRSRFAVVLELDIPLVCMPVLGLVRVLWTTDGA